MYSPAHQVWPGVGPPAGVHRSALDRAYGLQGGPPPPYVEVLYLGSGLAIPAVVELTKSVDPKQFPIAIVEAGGLVFPTHVGNLGLARAAALEYGACWVGGKTEVWGCQSPRPTSPSLDRWPWDRAVIERHFAEIETMLGVPEPVPFHGGRLEQALRSRLAGLVDGQQLCDVRSLPLAIARRGHHWSANDHLLDLIEQGVIVVPNARATRLEVDNGRVVRVHGVTSWGQPWTCEPRFVVLGTGIDSCFPLLADVLHPAQELAPSTHLRIDLIGWVERSQLGQWDAAEAGVTTLSLEYLLGAEVGYHLVLKAASTRDWPKLAIGDKVKVDGASDSHVKIVLQAVVQLHDGLTADGPIRPETRANPIRPVLSVRDARWQSQVYAEMERIGNAIGLRDAVFTQSPLLRSHHTFGLLRVGKGLTPTLALEHVANLRILAPIAYPAQDDHTNVTLPSMVANAISMRALAAELTGATPSFQVTQSTLGHYRLAEESGCATS